MLQAIRVAAITGSTISAAIRRMPTIRIETATVVAASTVEDDVQERDRHARDARALLVERDRGERAVEQRDRRQPADPRAPRRARGRCAVVVRIEPKRKPKRSTLSAPAIEIRTTPRRDARVEDERERLVAGRVLPGAQPLDRDRLRRSRRRARSAPARAPSRYPAATPANATWPIPSPIRLSCRWTRKKPTAGASRPTIAPAAKASRMNSSSSMRRGCRRVVPDAGEVARAGRRRRCRRGRARAARRSARPRRTRARRRGR